MIPFENLILPFLFSEYSVTASVSSAFIIHLTFPLLAIVNPWIIAGGAILIIGILYYLWKVTVRNQVSKALENYRYEYGAMSTDNQDKDEEISFFNPETYAFIRKRFNYPVPALVNRPQEFDNEGNVSINTLRYREFAQMLPDVVFESDLDGIVLFLNQVGHRLLHIDPASIREKRINMFDFVHPDDLDRAKEIFNDIIHNRSTKDEEFRVVRDGKLVMDAMTYSIPIVRNGNIVGLRIMLVDISDKKKHEETISTLYNVVSNIGFGIQVYALDESSEHPVFRLDVVNDASGKLFLFSKTGNHGKTIDELSPLLVQKGIPAVFDEVLRSGKRSEIEDFVYHPDPMQPLKRLHLWIFPLQNRKVALVMKDITNRKNSEISLKMNAVGIENACDAVLWIDETSRLFFANQAACRKYGYTKEELSDLSLVDVDTRITAIRWYEIMQILENKQTLLMESIHKNREQESFPAEMSFNKFVFDDKNYYLVFVRDVSDRKKNDELEQNIQVARKSAAIKQQFLANMSHEIRTPMTGIMGMTSLLMRTQLSPAQQEYVRNIKISSENLLNIINDVLDLSKIEAGKMELKPGRIDFREFVTEIREIYRHQAENKGLRFSTVIETGIPQYIIVDEQRLKQVINNLLSNAFKFTDEGEISIRFVLEQQKKNELLLRCDVMDTGMGISESNQRQIFEKFTQVDTSLIRPFEGTGLGLAICRELSHLMGGDINVTSVPEHGSTFSFTFKAQFDAHSTDNQEQAGKKEFLNMDINVLHVEDKLLNQKVVGFILFNAGCNVDFVKNGQEAIDKYVPGKYDVILMDIQMPVMDGITAYNELKRLYGDNLCPVIGLSANAMEGDEEKFISLGLDDYIVKPFQPVELYEKLLKWAGKRNKTRTTK
jgi:PAS domain S-box-containing protein